MDKNHKKSWKTFVCASLLSSWACAAPVMTWVPPYSPHIDEAYVALTSQWGGVGPAEGLSRLALQFWTVNSSGVAVPSDYPISDAKIQSFIDWGKSNNIKVLMCIYNGEYGWDWSLAQNAMNNKNVFVNSVLKVVDTKNLDGVDLDLEGNSDFSNDRNIYKSLVKDLADSLHKRKKILTMATFHGKIYNSPNQTWWSDWASFLDGVTPMGYSEIGNEVVCEYIDGEMSDWCHYDSELAKFKSSGGQGMNLTLGLPHSASWKSKSAEQHLDGVLGLLEPTGIAIWDATFVGWKSASIWNKVKAIKSWGENTSAILKSSQRGFIEQKSYESWTIMNITGQRLRMGKKSNIDLNQLKSGVYLIQITEKQQVYSFKHMVQ